MTVVRRRILTCNPEFMKKTMLFLGLMLFAFSVRSQTTNAIVFTENGEKFTAILNGLRQNDKPETNVKITGLNAEFYKLKVIFDNTALGEKNFNMALQFGTETTYSIRKNNKGEYVLRFLSSVPLAEAPSSPPSQTVVVYNTSPAPVPVSNQGQVTQTTTTTTTTHGTGDPDNVSLNMGINMGGEGGNISLNVSGMDVNSSETTVVHQTTTTSSTTTSSSTPVHDYPSTPAPAPVYLPGYSRAIGCPMPMSREDFASLKQTISSKTFEDTRMTIAKQVVSDRCLFVSQAKEIAQLFTFEESKLDFAKYAYDHTYDVGNYFKMNDVFTFETSIEELNQYISGRR